MSEFVEYDPVRLAELCRHWHVRKLSLFGSALRGELRADSDVDLLVEFEPDRVPGLAFFQLEDELTKLFRRAVDLQTAGFLSSRFRDEVVAEARALYAA